jgi:hypothetical protein
MFKMPAYDPVGIAILGFGVLAVAALAFELDETKRDAAKSRRFHKLMHTDLHGWLREIGLVSGEPKPPAPPIRRRRV